MNKEKGIKKLTHDEKLLKCEEFLKNFEDYGIGDVSEPYEQYGRRKYMIEMVCVILCSKKSPMMSRGSLRSCTKTLSLSSERKKKETWSMTSSQIPPEV